VVDVGVAVEVLLDDGVALAGGLLQAAGVLDVDDAAGVGDEAAILEDASGYGNRGAGAAEHVGEELMGHGEGCGVGAVLADEQPAGEAGFDFVLGIAGGGLHDLDKLGLDIAQSEDLELIAAEELAAGVFEGAGEAAAGNLGVDAIEAAMRAHEGGDADGGFIAEHADFNLGAVLEGDGLRRHALFNEVEMVDRLAGEFDFVAQLEVDFAQSQTLDRLRRKRPEESVCESAVVHVWPRSGFRVC
jgi:hypothetical protein